MTSSMWMHDVENANKSAFESWTAVLDRLEAMLDSSTDRSPRQLSEQIPRWNAALNEAAMASGRMKQGFKLLDSRSRDARNAGLEPPEWSGYRKQADDLKQRSGRLAARLRDRMADIAADLESRRPRRPRSRQFLPPPPSLVDIHV